MGSPPFLRFLIVMSVNSNIGPIVSSSIFFQSFLRNFSTQLKISHINCQSIRPSSNSFKFDELKNIVIGNFNIVGISETWLKPYSSNKSVGLPGYKLLRNDRLYSRGGGVAIFVSDQIEHTFVAKFSLPGCESIFMELIFGELKILFGVVYLPYGDLSLFEESHYELFSRYCNIVVVGDFNCNMLDVLKASRMRAMCGRCNLIVSHNCKPTFLDLVHNTTSLLDIWLLSDSSLMAFSDQAQCPSISRHAFMFASFNLGLNHQDRFIKYRDFNRIDWDGLNSFLSSFDSYSVFSSANVQTQSSVVNSLICSLYGFVPETMRKIRNNDNSWMNSREIVLAISLRDMAFSVFRTSTSTEDWTIYCKYRNKAKNIIRKVRRKFYSRLFSDLDNSGMWKVLKGYGATADNDYIGNFNADDVNSHFVNFSASVDSDELDFDSFVDANQSFSFSCVSDVDIYNAMSRIRSKSVGTDGIPIRFLKIIFPLISDILTFYINFILTSSSFPTIWKTARVVPIPKSRIVRNIDDLRPISILSSLSKVVEHIMKDQILVFVGNCISSSQYAFRRGHSTTSLLLNLTDEVRNSLNGGNLATMVSMDLAKAFNSVNFCVLIRKLRHLFNFSSSACRLIFSYLCERLQFVDICGSYSTLLPLSSGVPQGSVLGPLLFILYINDLPNYIDTSVCKSYLFADDAMLLFRTNIDNLDVLQSNIDFSIGRFLQWSSDNSLSVNLSKTKAILFGNTDLPELRICVSGSRVDFDDSMECLGIIIDRRLTFDLHIDRLSSKIIAILRRLYSIGIYLPKRNRSIVAHSLLMSILNYGLEVITGTLGYNVFVHT